MAEVTRFIALLRAVNVGGTGKLVMSDLKALCEDAGFHTVRTYIASGNVVFSTDENAAKAQAILEDHLHHHAEEPIPTFLRDADQMARIYASNPFPEAPGNKVAACLNLLRHRVRDCPVGVLLTPNKAATP